MPAESEAASQPPVRGLGRKLRNAVLALVLGFVLVVPILELGLRFLLFGDSGLARRLGASLRNAEYFADSNSEDVYWKLQYLFLDPEKQGPATQPDTVCGWTSGPVRSGTYEHIRAGELRGRRPVLLYGDSFAACNTESDQCFEGILERSDLADRYCLVNYGVGGYGVDQIHLLIRQSIDRWRDLDPIVAVGFLVDNDFDRNVLSFRCWPKPRLRVEGDRLESSGPLVVDPDEYLRQNPPGVASYLLRYLTYRRGMLPARWQWYLRRGTDKKEEKIALGRRILEEIHADLASRGLDHFFLAFHGEAGLDRTEGTRWVDELVDETARRIGAPVMPTRPFLLAAADGKVDRAKRFFGGAPKLVGHYNTMGNLVAFEALRAGIEGKFGEVDTSRVSEILSKLPFDDADQRVASTLFGCTARIRTRGQSGLVRLSRVPYPPFDPESKTEFLLLRPGEQGPSEVLVVVDGRSWRLRGRAMSVGKGDLPEQPDPLVLTVRVDGRVAFQERVPFHPDGVELDVDLTGATQLEIAADRTGSDPGSAWIHIGDARLDATR